jgi:peptidoglycan/LPS O-acetylase OafA/YrhL
MDHEPIAMDAVHRMPEQLNRSALGYRADIDGLRSVAVLSVLFFHVGFKAFSGGWVGVDVFFVISGFLITRLIVDEVDRGSFSFGKFYARRARRLFSSFIFTIVVCFVAGSLILDPVYWQHFAGEIVYSLAAASNIFYWLDGGYFGIAEEYKPLLHTWSLGVEEQFYLIWPLAITLMLRYKPRFVWPILGAAFVASLLAAEYFFYADRADAVFFLLPSRIFEFAIGAMLVWLLRSEPASEPIRVAALILGLALITYSVFFFTIQTPFPTVYALIPCGGAALVIYGGTADHLRSILGNPPMVWIGKVSYSLYLIHWPIIVFYKYHRLTPLTHIEQIAICICSLAAASLMYVFIEQPFRNPRRVQFSSNAALGFVCTAAVIILLIPASIIWAKGTLLWRGSGLSISNAELEQVEEQRKQDDVDNLLVDRSFAAADSRSRLMFLGDSHGGDIAGTLFLTLGADRFDYARLGFDDPCFSTVDSRPWILQIVGRQTACAVQISALKKSRSFAEAQYVFIANYWSEDTIKGFAEGLALLRSLTKAKIIVVGQNATFPTFDSSLRFLGTHQSQLLNTSFFEQQSSIDRKINEQLKLLASANGLGFINRQALVCSNSTARCRVVDADGKLLYSDRTHWSYPGRKVFGEMMVKKFGRLFLGDGV